MKTNKDIMVYEVLNSMTRNELRSLAKRINVPRGRNKKDTETNLEQAIYNDKAQFKAVVYIYALPVPPFAHGQILFVKKFRNYKPDKVIIPTANSLPKT